MPTAMFSPRPLRTRLAMWPPPAARNRITNSDGRAWGPLRGQLFEHILATVTIGGSRAQLGRCHPRPGRAAIRRGLSRGPHTALSYGNRPATETMTGRLIETVVYVSGR